MNYPEKIELVLTYKLNMALKTLKFLPKDHIRNGSLMQKFDNLVSYQQKSPANH